ncbi:MAG: 3-deoxy-D-manno-octulosonic acid transferase [Syntrophaceae bacterium]|nr:3-deoxy-D-manno-octulosonic acid transferase [Syntrophaceae bacterium]
MIHQLYNILLTFLLILSSPYFLLRGLIRKRFWKELTERIGFFPAPSFKWPIWVHAASVGEVFCCIPLLKRIKKEFPHCKIVLTTMTRTGNEQAKTVPEADFVFFVPIDHPLALQKAIGRVQPGLLLIAETELWPNLLRSCGEKGIPIILFNGRISEEAFRRYHFLKFFFNSYLEYISLFLMQTEEDGRRIMEIGAKIEKVKIVGNLKFDQPYPSFNQASLANMARSLRLRGDETLLIAGSTHSGEEEILVGLLKDLRRKDPNLVLILAPRHLQRLPEVEQILKKQSLSWKRRTWLSTEEPSGVPEVILLDTMGELMNLYSLGTLTFIGGSLVPVGGHNPIEPLFFKKCVLFGPHMFHFEEVSRRLIEAGAAVQVRGREDLAFQVSRLLSDEKARKEMGEKGYQFLEKHRGATERTFEEIRPFLTDIGDRRF